MLLILGGCFHAPTTGLQFGKAQKECSNNRGSGELASVHDKQKAVFLNECEPLVVFLYSFLSHSFIAKAVLSPRIQESLSKKAIVTKSYSTNHIIFGIISSDSYTSKVYC